MKKIAITTSALVVFLGLFSAESLAVRTVPMKAQKAKLVLYSDPTPHGQPLRQSTRINLESVYQKVENDQARIEKLRSEGKKEKEVQPNYILPSTLNQFSPPKVLMQLDSVHVSDPYQVEHIFSEQLKPMFQELLEQSLNKNNNSK